MANWYGTSRTNYVRISDPEGLAAAVERWCMQTEDDSEGRTAFFPNSMNDTGDWLSFDEDDVEFDFAEHIMPFVAEGEVLIEMVTGAEKSRYVTGYANAHIRRGTKVECTTIALYDIYDMAAKVFGVDRNTITPCEY